jgi:hypothetical protein
MTPKSEYAETQRQIVASPLANQHQAKVSRRLDADWTLRNSIRGATREVDQQYPEPKFSLLEKQLIALFVVFAGLFLLAYEVGLISLLF